MNQREILSKKNTPLSSFRYPLNPISPKKFNNTRNAVTPGPNLRNP